MGAMARLLGVRLGKPGVYQLHPQGQEPQPAHLLRAVFYARNVVLALAGIGAAAMLLGADDGAHALLFLIAPSPGWTRAWA